MQELTILGAGRTAKVLAFLWSREKIFAIRQVLTSQLITAKKAVEFIGSGEPIAEFAQVNACNNYFIAVPDDVIVAIAKQLAQRHIIKPGDLVFHCSGTLSSDVLEPVKAQGAIIASCHPIYSFADLSFASENFVNIYCTLEGDDNACQQLKKVFASIGGQAEICTQLDKELYHASLVMVSNYLVTLYRIGLDCFAKVGITEKKGLAMLAPLMQASLQQCAQNGPIEALTGPVARGDVEIIKKHLRSLKKTLPQYETLYRQLGKNTLELVQQRGQVSADITQQIQQILQEGQDE